MEHRHCVEAQVTGPHPVLIASLVVRLIDTWLVIVSHQNSEMRWLGLMCRYVRTTNAIN